MKKILFFAFCLCALNFGHNIAYSMGSDGSSVAKGKVLFEPCLQCHFSNGEVDPAIAQMNRNQFRNFVDQYLDGNVTPNQYFMHYVLNEYSGEQLDELAAYVSLLNREYLQNQSSESRQN